MWFCSTCGNEAGTGWADLGGGKIACADCLSNDKELKAQADDVHDWDEAFVKGQLAANKEHPTPRQPIKIDFGAFRQGYGYCNLLNAGVFDVPTHPLLCKCPNKNTTNAHWYCLFHNCQHWSLAQTIKKERSDGGE